MFASFGDIVWDSLHSMAHVPAVEDAEHGDFRDEEGLLCCGVCRKPKEAKIELFGMLKTVPCACACAMGEWERKQAEFKERQRRERVRQLRVNGIQDEGLRGKTFDEADMNPQMERCKYYADNFEEFKTENIGMIFCGAVGSGKTFAAACIANALIDKGIPVLMTSFPRILNAGYEKNELVREAQEFDLVIIDDLGTERQSDYALETVYYFLDERYKSGKPIIITTNLSKTDLEKPIGTDYARIYSRVLEMCLVMTFPDRNRRVAQADEKRQRAKELMQKLMGGETA